MSSDHTRILKFTMALLFVFATVGLTWSFLPSLNLGFDSANAPSPAPPAFSTADLQKKWLNKRKEIGLHGPNGASTEAHELHSSTSLPGKPTLKLQGPLQVSLQRVSPPDDDTLVLKVVVTSSEAIDRVDLRMVLPEGVNLLQGSPTWTLTNVKSLEPAVTEIKIKASKETDAVIHFLASGQVKQMRFTTTANFHTLLEEEVRREEKALLKNFENSLDKKRLKVYQ